MNDEIKIDNTGPVIIIDDDSDELMITKRLYKKCELENDLLLFDSAQTFLSEVVTYEQMPSVVFLDVNMPGEDGFEILEQIRGLSEPFNTMKIIIFTNSNSPKDKEKAIEAKADGFASKPVRANELVEFFNSLKA